MHPRHVTNSGCNDDRGWSAGGRDAAGLLPLLQCLGKFLVDPRYSRLLLGVAHRVLDAYAGEVNPVLLLCSSCLSHVAELVNSNEI